jgi:hypothetical protein
MSTLTSTQLKVLFSELHQSRVGHNQKGFAHVQQWDVRRFLIRVFGFGGYDTELVSIDLIREIEHPASSQGGKSRWTVAYRVHQRLTVKDIHGQPIATFDGVATGDSQNQPSLGDAHDGAVKEADSQSLKRAAVNLGDAFGLALYNGGGTAAVVKWSAAHQPEAAESAEAPMPELDADPPVQPEPQQESTEAPEPAPEKRAEQRPQRPAEPTRIAPRPAAPDEREAALTAMREAAEQIGFTDGLPKQFVESFGHPIEQGTTAEFKQARELMTGSAAA